MASTEEIRDAIARLPRGSKVTLELADGQTVEGTLSGIEADAVTLEDRDAPLAASQVERVLLDIGTDGPE